MASSSSPAPGASVCASSPLKVSSTLPSSTSTTPTPTLGHSTSLKPPPPSLSLTTPLSSAISEPNVPFSHKQEHQSSLSVFRTALGTKKPIEAPRSRVMSEEHSKCVTRTHERVERATEAVMAAAGLTRETLLTASAVDSVPVVPFPQLVSAARVLLKIWEAVLPIDTNWRACLRLTERCAEILFSICDMVQALGDEELNMPMRWLINSFTDIHTFLQRHHQAHRSFLQWHFKRDGSAAKIQWCNNWLDMTLHLFQLSAETQRIKQGKDMRALLEKMYREMLDLRASVQHLSELVPSLPSSSLSPSRLRALLPPSFPPASL